MGCPHHQPSPIYLNFSHLTLTPLSNPSCAFIWYLRASKQLSSKPSVFAPLSVVETATYLRPSIKPNKIKIKAHAGVLTNFEVLDLLRSRGATSDPLGSLGAVTPSEWKVFDYLIRSSSCNQTRENVKEFWKRSDEFGLEQADKLNIINTRPSSDAEIFPNIEDCEERLDGRLEELVNLVVEILPPPPGEAEAEVDDKKADQN